MRVNNKYKWLNYWKNSLADAQRISVKIDLDKTESFEGIDLNRGQLPPENVIPIIDKEEKRINKKKGITKKTNKDWEEVNTAPIIISPFYLIPKREHLIASKNSKPIFPFWILARVDREGFLSVDEELFPFVPRDTLSPLGNEEQDFTFSSVELVDKAAILDKKEFWTWDEYWHYILRVFKLLTDQEYATYQIQDFQVNNIVHFFTPDPQIIASAGIINLYEQLINRKSKTPLLDQLMTLESPENKEPVAIENYLHVNSKHLGQMGDNFPLSITQRRSLYTFLNNKTNPILAVNGPPGTGKTTLLQSIVANLVVEKAIEDGDPPIILACSTNNQAVTNIIESFSKADSKQESLSERWLPDLLGYATYLPSSSKEPKDLKGINYLKKKNGEGSILRYENEQYVETAEHYFLEKVNTYFDESFSSVRKARKFLRKEIVQIKEQMELIPKFWNLNKEKAVVTNPLKWRAWKEKNGINGDPVFSDEENWKLEYNKIKTNDFSPCYLYDELDVSIRYKAFLLATHYWEARWLEKMKEEYHDEIQEGYGEGAAVTQWERRAMLTPCFVSTFYMAPKFFSYSKYAGKDDTDTIIWENPPLTNFIDLLIVDESGQVSPEIGIATFSLAKKAVVVGDVKQIEPVWNIPPNVDIGNLRKGKLLEVPFEEEEINKYDEKGFIVSSGSIMKMAQNACPFVTEGVNERGLLLTEHRRCNDEIIDYCNELAYSGLLKPMKGQASENQLFPSLQHINVTGESVKAHNSKANIFEEDAIANWLIDNANAIQKQYGSIESQVGIITPFVGQKLELQKRLKEIGLDIYKMKIGTVHALQGAERPIILFSTVYDEKHKGEMFFDRDNKPNMLNVAVSRAQDSFIVFGNAAILNKKNNTPSAILGKFLKVNTNL